MESRKLREYSLADILLVYSDFHKKTFELEGFPEDRLFVVPLWIDPVFWHPTKPKRVADMKRDIPLRVLFVGAVNLRKGIPFLLRAIAECGKAVQLTMIGPRSSQTSRLLDHTMSNVRYLGAQPKVLLREAYQSHDLFVLPSVSNSFGYVALEAMACGLPVIVTENCGAPVPDASWRVPAMDPDSLAEHIMKYADDRTLVLNDGERAASFAAEFTPGCYRRNIQSLLKDILCRQAASAAHKAGDCTSP